MTGVGSVLVEAGGRGKGLRGGGGVSGRATDSWSKGLGVECRQEQRDNFLLNNQLFMLTVISVSVPPWQCYSSNTQKVPVILPKVQVAGYS